MKTEITWADIRRILDILGLEDSSRVMSINIDPDTVNVEERFGLLGFQEHTVYITGDRRELERKPVEAPALGNLDEQA